MFYQLSHITRDRGSLIHDDRLDAVAIGVRYIVDFMGIDADQGIKELNENFLEDSLEGLFRHYTTRIYGNITDTDYDGL